VIVAELEVWHSRPVAPTRRVALGAAHLPYEPVPGPGGILLAALLAAHLHSLSDDDRDDVTRLAGDLERGRRVAQPRLRHRLQLDRVGLMCTRHRLVLRAGTLQLDLAATGGAPQQHVLAALYAAGGAPQRVRPAVFEALRVAMSWEGAPGPALVARLGGAAVGAAAGERDAVRWALGVLDLEGLAHELRDHDDRPRASAVELQIQRRYRDLLRAAHPDHGASHDGAAARIEELREARRILLT
jgi:hypothetical protein